MAREYQCDDPLLSTLTDTHPIVTKLCLHVYKEQKSSGWLEDRSNMITASAIATLLNMGFEHPIFPNFPFLQSHDLMKEKAYLKEAWAGSTASEHGVTNEPIARKCYMERFQNDLVLFGLIPHAMYKFIGASPDAICRIESKMVEIKCPHSRPVKEGNLIPCQYWMQCQLQMEVCDVDACDYFEFKQMKRPPVARINLVHLKRDREWFQLVLPLMQKFMEYVYMLRNMSKHFDE